jgi:uncharacterized membrane protein
MNGTAVALRRGFIAACVGWAVALPAAAFLLSHATGSMLQATAAVAYAMGSVVCHQIPARSFQLWSSPLPVCARCTGIYVGAAAVAIMGGLGVRFPVAQAGRPARLLLGAAILPTLATLAYEWSVGAAPSNVIRAVAALALGAAASAVRTTAADDGVN